MKIDPVTFEVDASGGTRPVYVWEAPVRVWHWLMAVAMFAMIITGYLIGRPLVSNLGDTWITYDFGYVRMVHFAVLHGALHLPPLLGGGGQPLREDDLLPAAVVDEVVEGGVRPGRLLPLHEEVRA